MSEQKALQFLDKHDLECAICLERLREPKTLECLHSYCLHCLQSFIKTSGKIKCPKCCKIYDDLNQFDLNNLTSNEMLSCQVKYVGNIESGKPSTCSSCDNQPEYYCSECKMYLCGQCTQDHKKFPVLKDHSLYRLDKKEEDDFPDKCKFHSYRILEFYCSNCCKSGCEKCEHVLHCYQNGHNVIPFKIAVEEFNKNVTEVMKIAEEIKDKLKETSDTITKERSDFESRIQICRTAIGLQEENMMKKIQEKSRTTMADLDKIEQENKKVGVDVVKQIDSKLTQVNEMLPLFTTMMNKPEERETLKSHEANITDFRNEAWETKFDESSFKKLAPSFIPSKNLDRMIDLEGIGKIANANCAYEVSEDDKSITITKGQPFEVKVSSSAGSETCLLSATIFNESGEESATEVKHQGSGEYKITGRCQKVGDWKMKITAKGEEIKGSPVDIKVEAPGLVHTIDNTVNEKLIDVVLDKNGCLIVSSQSKQLFKFNQEYSFIGIMEVPGEANVFCMHQMDDGHIVYSDFLNKTVVMCDDQFKQICVFGKGSLKDPRGLTVNKETRTMYVADWKCHCVFKFHLDSGKLLSKIGPMGSNKGQMINPEGVTLTKEGNLIVADSRNHRIKMFDANDKFMRILVDSGEEDGYVESPYNIIIDCEENILISSINKLQLFDKNGVFIKRIDDGGLSIPGGLSLISNRPRRVAVADEDLNNLKIYNY
ncbi:uncharacterized protein [Antedon mediterranea]|uniref:uncharacterized protein n=1 Tax=Antedon mediterranea TaxID=105859 RepID=UPI003AF90995